MERGLITSSLLVAVTCLGLAGATLAFEAALPWLPVTVGYEQTRLERARVYSPAGETLRDEYRTVDFLMREVEAFQGLEFVKPVTVIVTRDWGSFNRGTLTSIWRRPQPVLGAALQTGTVVYVSPLLLDPVRRPDWVIRHELSHALLFQHVSLRDSYALRTQRWLLEGLAVHIGNPGDYLTDAAFAATARRTGYVSHIGERDGGRAGPEQSGAFEVTQYRRFIEYLIGHYGINRLQHLVRAAVRTPRAVDQAFEQVYGVTLVHAGREFEACVVASRCAAVEGGSDERGSRRWANPVADAYPGAAGHRVRGAGF